MAGNVPGRLAVGLMLKVEAVYSTITDMNVIKMGLLCRSKLVCGTPELLQLTGWI